MPLRRLVVNPPSASSPPSSSSNSSSSDEDNHRRYICGANNLHQSPGDLLDSRARTSYLSEREDSDWRQRELNATFASMLHRKSESVSHGDRQTKCGSQNDLDKLHNISNGETFDIEDERLIQVAVRCRPRKRRRNERRAAIAAEIRRTSDWMMKRRSSVTSLEDSESSSSDDGNGDRGNGPRYGATSYRGTLEYSHETSDSRFHKIGQCRKPRLTVQGISQNGSVGIRRQFEYDFIFPPWKSQAEVYDECVRGQIAHVLQVHEHYGEPVHATIVAYGQTGTGKTYTMGMLSDTRDEAVKGIIPRAFEQIMQYADNWNDRQQQQQQDVANPKFPGDSGCDGMLVVTMSFLQIYLETVQDLLTFPMGSFYESSGTARKRQGKVGELQVRQKQNKSFYVEGLNEYEIKTIEDARLLLETATQNRILATTARNKTSSRSHTLLTVSLKQTKKRRNQRSKHREEWVDSDVDDCVDDSFNSEDGYEDEEKAFTISFVDLAGSERVDGALHFLRSTRKRQELRIREAKFINRSLSALGSVISALAQPKLQPRGTQTMAPIKSGRHHQPPRAHQYHSQRHIRFRDSQLTKLLQGRLMDGRGRLVLIATVDDQPGNIPETLSTLKFAAQCRRVDFQSSRSKAAAERKESLLNQVFQEMKTMYEEREATLHCDYQARIEALENELQALRKTCNANPVVDIPASESHQPSSNSQKLHLASYLALCSLVDHLKSNTDQQQSNGTSHPKFESFATESARIQYVGGLYHTLKKALTRKIGSLDPTPTNEPSKTVEAPLRATAVALNGLQQHEQPQQQPVNRNKLQKLTTTQETDFRTIARYLVGSPGLLDDMSVSSEDECEESFSQLEFYAKGH